MTWKELGLTNYRSAKLLLKNSDWRSSVNRSYYAVYAVIAGELEGRVTYPNGLKNPSHDTLPKLVLTHLVKLTMDNRRRVSKRLIRLVGSRVDADYRPYRTVNRTTATTAVIAATEILGLIGAL